MKKLILSSLILISLALILTSCSSLPNKHPILEVSSKEDDVTFEASTNGGNWFEKSEGGNSFDLGTFDLNRLSEIESYTVSCNTKIDLNLSYTKDLEVFKVSSIVGDSILNESLVEVESSNYSFTTPKEPGEYGYIIETRWDDTHNIRFIIKLNCIIK